MRTIIERSSGADVYAACIEPRTGALSEEIIRHQVKIADSLSKITEFLEPTDDPCHNRDIEAALQGLVDKVDSDPQFLATHAKQLRKMLGKIKEKTADYADIQELVHWLRSCIAYALKYNNE